MRRLARGRLPEEREDGEAHLVAVALRELAAARGFEQQGQVGEFGLRGLPAESAVEQVVQRQRGEPLLAADDVGDLHQVIVHDVGQMVGRQCVGRLVEHLVVERRGVDLHVAADQVVHPHRLVGRHLEADDPLVAALDARPHLVGRQGERRGEPFAYRGVVGEGLAAFLVLRAQGVQLVGRVEGVVGPARVDELQGVFQVDFAPFALAVGGVGAALPDALVDMDAAPFE